MVPITAMDRQTGRSIAYVLLDIDGTITSDGKVPACAYAALWRLHSAAVKVLPITGRPAGWCDLIARQWPVDGVVGENGAFAFWEEDGHVRRLYHEQAVPNTHPILERIKKRALAEVPLCRIAQDQFCRMFDLAIDFAEEEPRLSLEDAMLIKRICEEEGAQAKISSIHVNTWMGTYNKLSMTLRFLKERFGYDDETDAYRVLFFGDSPNDEPMFFHFINSVGVAGVHRYAHLMSHLPVFCTSLANGEGFAEGVDTLLCLRS